MSIRGQVVDNAGQRSSRLVPGGNYDEYMAEDQVVDNTRILESKETSLDLNSDETIRLVIRLELRLAEMDKKLQTIMETRLNSRPLPRMENDVNSTIIQGTPSTVLECMSIELEELVQARYTDRIIMEELTLEALEIQDRINSSMMTPTTEFANKKKDSRQSENRSREQDIVRKGMERLEKEISQYTQVQVSKEQVDIALLQRCKTTDIPAVNLAITNIQKALEKYVGFNNIDSQYCDKVGEVMDKA